MTVIHIEIGKAQDLHQAAYYFAEAGLQNQIEVMANHMELLYRNGSTAYNKNDFYISMINVPIEPISFKPYKGHQVKLRIIKNYKRFANGSVRFTIYSRCIIGEIERALKAKIDILWEDPSEPEFKLDEDNFRIIQYGETYERVI